MKALKPFEPSLFDVDPEQSAAICTTGEPLGQPQALQPSSIDGAQHPATPGGAGVDVDERNACLASGVSKTIGNLSGTAGHPSAYHAERVRSSDDEWREVPATLFLSWSLPRQLDYCARRDEHASLYCQDDFEGCVTFYIERTASYRQMMKEVL